jgi:hypothetical protein
MFTKPVASPRVQFREDIIENDYRITRDGTPPDHVDLG